MNFLKLNILIGFWFSAQFASAASPVLDCYKLAMQDSEVFADIKDRYDPKKAEEKAVRLCSGVVESTESIECYKSAMKDPEIFTDMKKRYNLEVAEAQAVLLCSKKAN